MIEIIPSLLVESAEEFERRLRFVDQHVKTVHVDILDGTLFPKMSWHDPQVVGDIVTPVVYELHLMVKNPLPIIEAWKTHVPNLTRAIIHAELDRPLSAILEYTHQTLRLETGIALNPETPIDEIHAHIPNADEILIMGVHPDASGQPFLGETILRKITEAHQRYPQMILGCDGGIKQDNYQHIAAQGANRLVVASALFHTPDPLQALQNFQQSLSTL